METKYAGKSIEDLKQVRRDANIRLNINKEVQPYWDTDTRESLKSPVNAILDNIYGKYGDLTVCKRN